MAITLECKDPLKKGCGWSGGRDELVAATDDLNDRDFTHCPGCNGTDFFEEDDEEN